MNFVNSMAFTAITFVAFTALVALISWWKTRGDNLDTQDGYYLGGRSLTGPVIAGSLLMTNLSAEQLVGNNGQAVRVGMSTMGWEVTSAIALVILAFVLMPKYLKTGLTTVPQFFEQRYDEGTRRLVSIIVLLSYVVIMLPNILYAGAQVFVNIFGIDKMFGISRFAAIAIVCVATAIVGSIYAIFGGLKAVAVSDTINGIGLIIGGLMIPFLGFAALSAATGGHGIMDGIKYMVEADPAKMNAINAWNAPEPEVPWPLIITGMFFNNLYWWCTNQSFVQRSLAAKSLKEGQKGAIFCGFLKCLGPLYLVIPGVIAFYLPSIQDKLAAAGSSAIDFAYPALIAEIVPKPVMGFFAAVMFGAILSSFNSVLNSASTMFTLDLYRSSINPKASDTKCVKVGKIYGTIAGCIAIVISPFVMYAGGITTFLNSMSQFVSLPVLCTILGIFMFKRIPKYMPKVITVFHVVCYGAFLLIKPCYPGSSNPIHYLYAMAVLFPIELLIMWYLNKYHPAEEYEIRDVGAVDLTPWKYRHIVSIIGLLLAIGIYILFSPLGIAA